MRELAETLEITYQQMQKYETGLDTLSPAKLAALAQTLGVTIGHFFQPPDATESDADSLNLKDARLMRRLRQIELRRPDVYLAIYELVAAMTTTEE
jgi:transcriptional regulator with XRE-family HTH domain